MPVSATRMRSLRLLSSFLQESVTEPAAVNLAAFCSRLSITRVM